MLDPVVLGVDLLEEVGCFGEHGVAVDWLAEFDEDCYGEPGDPR